MKIGRLKKRITNTYSLEHPPDDELFIMTLLLGDSTNRGAAEDCLYRTGYYTGSGGNSISFHREDGKVCIHFLYEDIHDELEEDEECSLAIRMAREDLIALLETWKKLRFAEKIILVKQEDKFELYEQHEFIKKFGSKPIEDLGWEL